MHFFQIKIEFVQFNEGCSSEQIKLCGPIAYVKSYVDNDKNSKKNWKKNKQTNDNLRSVIV